MTAFHENLRRRGTDEVASRQEKEPTSDVGSRFLEGLAVSSRDRRTDEEPTGFGGLSGMVTDLQDGVSKPSPSPESHKELHPALPVAPPALGQRATPIAPEPRLYRQPSQSGPATSGRRWLWGLAAVAAIAWLWTQSADDKEVMPKPGGMNRKLSSSEIRYCVSEDIRIGAAKSVVNAYVEWEVDRFNQMVSDYNARCGMYQYSRGTLESVRSSVEKRRAELEAEGRARIQ